MNETEIKIDASTGLPEIPDNMFWQVYEGEGYNTGYLYVALVRKPSKKYGNSWQRYWDESGKYDDKVIREYCREFRDIRSDAEALGEPYELHIKQNILHIAEQIMKAEATRLRQAEFDGMIEAYTGNYPPKSLN